MSSRTVMGAPRAPRRTQRGVVLFIALIILVAMTLSGIALVRSVDTTSVIAGNLAFKQGTMMATDVGVEAASRKLVELLLADATASDDASKNYSASYNPANAAPNQLTAALATNVLTDVSGTGNTVRYWMERMCLVTGAVTATGCIREEGRDVPYYRVTTRVEGPRNTLAITQTTIQTPGQFVPEHAILTEGKLNMSATISVGGAGGNIHSNTRVEMSGTTVLTLPTGAVSAVGSHAASGKTQGVFNSGAFTGGITENAAAIDIPEFNPTDYKQYADIRLQKDGSVVNRLDVVLMSAADGQAGKKWLGWSYVAPGAGAASALADPGTPPTLANINKLAKWVLLDDNSWSSGMVYVEGHAEVGSTPGKHCTPAPCTHAKGPNPWVISIVATGDVRMNNANIQDYRDETLKRWAELATTPGQGLQSLPPPNPYNDNTAPAIPPWTGKPAVPTAVQNLFLVAGLDLKFDGSVNQTGPEALMTAREQFTISGTTTLQGSIIASDKYAVSPLLTQNLVSGSTTITYSGNLTAPATRGVSRRVTWRAIQ